MPDNLHSPTGASVRSIRPVPLFSLAQPALALGEDLAVGAPGEDNNAGEIWNVITRAADLVKDGERLENLAWRHWGQPRRSFHGSHNSRRLSMSSNGTASTSSLHTLHTPNDPSPVLHRSRSFEKRTFGGALKLLLEENESHFKDWVEEAKKHLPSPISPSPSPPIMPVISVPDTPVANVEIRLVEPTPVPSRVGSLGGSMGAPGLLGTTAAVPPALREDEDEGEEEEEEELADEPEPSHKFKAKIAPIQTPSRSSTTRSRSPKKKSKFFVQSSPTKGSGSDTSHPSPVAPSKERLPSPPHMSTHGQLGVSAGLSATQPPQQSQARTQIQPPQAPTTPPKPSKHARRRSSGGFSNGLPHKSQAQPQVQQSQPQASSQKRHVSLSTMKGKYHAEKRRMVEQQQKAKENEESGWEDEDENEAEEDWSDEQEDAAQVTKDKGKEKEPTDQNEGEGDWSDEEAEKPTSSDGQKRPQHQPRRASNPSRPSASRSKSHTQLDFGALLMRKSSRSDNHDTTPPQSDAPPPPAPTPLRRMSKRERAAAAAERAEIEAQLQAQRQREMFAKQRIFGENRPAAHTGLLANALRSGMSMVNLQSAAGPSIRPSPTHGQLTSLAFSPTPAPALLRSKSAVAMPVQTGVSVTVPPHALDKRKGGSSKHRNSSEERSAAQAEVEMESDTEDSDADADYLNNTRTRDKLAEIAAKRDAKDKSVARALPQVLPSGQRTDEYGVVQPMTPTTRRRAIIMSEMSESLRRNVVLEREKSAGAALRPRFTYMQPQPTASTSATRISSRASADNLPQYGGGQALERHNSQPSRFTHGGGHGGGGYLPPIYSEANSPASNKSEIGRSASPVASAVVHPPPAGHADPPRRRPQPSVLGGAYLRPLTRATTDTITATRPSPSASNSVNNSALGLSRAQSSAALVTGAGSVGSGSSVSPRTGLPEAPAMARRSTDHEGLQMQMDKEREARRRELVKRRETTDTSYRFHGW